MNLKILDFQSSLAKSPIPHEKQRDTLSIHSMKNTVNNWEKCPTCDGPADNGNDRSYPPNAYECTKCEKTELEKNVCGLEGCECHTAPTHSTQERTKWLCGSCGRDGCPCRSQKPLQEREVSAPANEIIKELDDILLDICDQDCIKTHQPEEHVIIKSVIRDRLITLITSSRQTIYKELIDAIEGEIEDNRLSDEEIAFDNGLVRAAQIIKQKHPRCF